ncbi:MAG: DUF11 domain-containing protein, partial [Acidobacteria bacterium]|nr:DUF11 domain-containing protein [Acidobacteriota bacterium]
PAGVSIASSTPSQGSFVSPTWTVGTLSAGSNATLTVVLTASAAASPGTDVICDTASVTGANETLVNTGDDSASECTSIVLAADLSLTKVDDADPPPAGMPLTYTLTVENLGPSNATSVVVTDPLPAGVTYSSDDCGGSNVPPWTWNIGNLGVGAMVTCNVVVTIDPSPPGSISNTAQVTGDQFDPNVANNSDTEVTTLDNVPPTVDVFDAVPATSDGVLDECETVQQSVSGFRVVFSEAMANPPGDGGAGDVTSPASYLLVRPGPDFDFATTACGAVGGDDVAIPITGVSYDGGTFTATLTTATLPPSQYRVFACDTLTDAAGNALDGDGDAGAGGDFERGFRADPDNLFANGHFDCGIAGWTLSAATAGEITWDGAVDADAADGSGSAAVSNLLPGTDTTFSLDQCVPVAGGVPHHLDARLRLDAAPGVLLSWVRSCQFFSSPGCVGSVGNASRTDVFTDTASGWVEIADTLPVPAGAVSARCTLRLRTPTGAAFDAWLDAAELVGPEVIFIDGFESGDTSAWSACEGCVP